MTDLTKPSLTYSQKQELASLLELANRRRRWRSNPLSYLQERLGIDPKTVDWSLLPQYQNHTWDGTPNPFVAILDGLVKSQWVGVESGNAVGKTHLGACVSLWFLECYPGSMVIT